MNIYLGIKTISPSGLYPLHIFLMNWKYFKDLELKYSVNQSFNQKSKLDEIFQLLSQIDSTGNFMIHFFYFLFFSFLLFFFFFVFLIKIYIVYTLKTEYTKNLKNNNHGGVYNSSPLNYFSSSSNFSWGGMLPLHIACRISVPQNIMEFILNTYLKGIINILYSSFIQLKCFLYNSFLLGATEVDENGLTPLHWLLINTDPNIIASVTKFLSIFPEGL